MRILCSMFLALLVLGAMEHDALAIEVKAFKDKRFVNAPLLSDEGWLRVFEYDELRDVNGRDDEPGYRAKQRFVFPVRGGFRKITVAPAGGGLVHYEAAAQASKAKFLVGFFHGARGSSKLGINPRSFGGNFGRLHNLVARSGGRYVSFGFSDFSEQGALQVSALLTQQKAANPNAPIILACGSQGSHLCWQLAKSSKTNKLFDGIVLLGGQQDDEILRGINRGTIPKWPIFIAHGSQDKTFAEKDVRAFAKLLRNEDVPVRMDVFDTGNHGTPIRMIDWRYALNWILSQ